MIKYQISYFASFSAAAKAAGAAAGAAREESAAAAREPAEGGRQLFGQQNGCQDPHRSVTPQTRG